MLNNDVLLYIFHLHHLDVRDEYDRNDSTLTNSPNWGRERWWYKLAHVCKRWRNLILASPSTLGLHLVCTYGTPVVDMLENSPPLPLIITYLIQSREPTPEDEEGILHALKPEYRDRVRRIGLCMPASNLQNIVEAMDESFPNLEYMLIKSESMAKSDAGLILPKKFQAPQLNRLKLWGIVPPIGSLLLPTTNNMGLVALTLSDIPPSAFDPSYLHARLSQMPQLESLIITFCSPLPNREVKWQLLKAPIRMDATLPNLRFFGFRGVSAYLDSLVARITAPLLSTFHIHFFNQLTFSIPHLSQFLNATENIRIHSIRLVFVAGSGSAILANDPGRRDQIYPLTIAVLCGQGDWQVASAARILNELQTVLSASEELALACVEDDLFSEVDRTSWRGLLSPFSNITTLNVQNKLIGKLSRSLQFEDGELPQDLLPNLKELGYSPGLNARDSFTPFINERQIAGRLVSLKMVDFPIYEWK